MRFPLLFFITVFTLQACQPSTQSVSEQTQAAADGADAEQVSNSDSFYYSNDYHSFANPEQVLVTHLDWDVTVDFDARKLQAVAHLQYEKVDPAATTLIVDTRALQVSKIEANDQQLDFTLAEPDENLGTALHISLPEQGSVVSIHYSTSPDASGVQWLTPEQTASKTSPFLFTQAQAIHARSFIPIQDSPGVRITYSATVRTPENLLAVMSARNEPDTARDGVYEFTMPQPIPSYLIALAVGNLEFKAMGERTGVYAEPPLLDAAAKEFEDTEAMLIATENKYGAYAWERYDLLILPPSFPFGGMENPRLSFITPTVIAGDKSLVALIAHELAHSWSGNTVTNATWRDLWLNEGFTTYLTYRIMEMIYGEDRYRMEAVLGMQDLQQDLQTLSAGDQIMAIDLRGRDADDVFSNIPYEKGALFLRDLEQTVGREAFDQFLLEYFDAFAFKSITTDQFLDYLQQTLAAQYPDKVDMQRIEQWILKPGLPANVPVVESDAFSSIDHQRQQFLQGEIRAADIKVGNWTYHQWNYFLRGLPESLSIDQMSALDSAFNLTQVSNNEIAHTWLLLAIQKQYQPAYERLYNYLTGIGRNKLVRPLYAELAKTEQGKAFAKRAFEEAKSGYHPLTIKANQDFVN
ncbi:M1 family metallopeptidase [Aestuariibacter salexigens]|uniref:M1 family metallopeptidase n=1 Tax=Aestuariibacter salexigens TaxID=226010 RepID=UPI00042369CE|nr:M1 family metallopeptidase [Aestuariibacter salexigens]